MTTRHPGRDRLRELLDAVLDDHGDGADVQSLAAHAHSSPCHFSRQVSRAAGESPAAMRRRVLLERAAWELQRDQTVTDAAYTAGYDSVEGFSRAFSLAMTRDVERRGAWGGVDIGHLDPGPIMWHRRASGGKS